MRRLALTVLVLASTLLITSARAGADVPDIRHIMGAARASVVVPIQWDGAWTTTDTMYSCAGAFKNTSAGTDTICGGKDFNPAVFDPSYNFQCTGSANATSFDMHCTASFTPITDCTVNYDMVFHGTVSGDNYYIVETLNTTYVGTGCGGLPATCSQINTRGTRVGPAPSSYCTTPTLKSTWGRLKSIYR